MNSSQAVIATIDQTVSSALLVNVPEFSKRKEFKKHTDTARQHMVTWRDKTKPMTVESLKGIQEYAKTYLEVVSPDLKKRLPKLQSGNKEEFKRYKSDLEILWKTFKTHEEHLKDASNGILTLFNNLSNDSAVFTTDLEVAKGDIATEKIKEQHIKDSIQSFKDEISRARKWELIGLVFGPLGYGIARIWGDNIANIQGLEKKISELESNLEKEHQEAVVLTSLLGRLSILANTFSFLGTAMNALSNGMSANRSEVKSVMDSLVEAEKNPSEFTGARLDAVSSNCKSLLSELSTVMGEAK
ncbi:HBL/NHE enterotoxin family protein [Streptomyces albireticuli]|uniref:Uncharacterized protein n=2 Tax=Streptomyces albireticuli TaxID=1940 RepID=A0A2A2DDU9_9ACTN|nr:HBL/NHE enterotoxin family protein [Streptomyces albireticuli]PAU50668.1 hypothetical protein CK936_01305 [Streptomyces albireticuli]